MSWLIFNRTTVGIVEIYANQRQQTHKEKLVYDHNKLN